MSGPSLSDAGYSTLNTYALLSSSASTAGAATTITNGKYGSDPTATNDPEFIGTQANGANAGTSQLELTALLNDIGAYGPSGGSVPLTGPITTAYTFLPNRKYTSTGLTFDPGSSLIFDGQGDPNAKFFIIDTSQITFGSVSEISLINGATNGNIFIIAGSAIVFSGTMPSGIYGVSGVFIAQSKITFANAVNVYGRLYAQTENVTFLGVSSVNGLITLVSPICFPGNTPVKTDQGIMPIATIIPNFHTIDGERIVAITKTIDSADSLICFEKDSLGRMFPSKRTIMSRNHKIQYKGFMYKAYKFVGRFPGVTSVPYTGEPLFNVLMETYRAISVNNLICETVHPNNPIADLFKKMCNPTPEMICA